MRLNITDLVVDDDDLDDSSHGRIEDVTDLVEDEYVREKCFVCDDQGVVKSEAYPGLVSYCGEEHRRLHYPEDVDVEGDREEEERSSSSPVLPFPFLVKFRPGVGRYMVAARNISAGELIFREDPIAMGPNHSAPPSCLECMRKVDGSYLCPKCSFPMCEEMCAYGEEHAEKECAVFAAMKEKVVVDNFEERDTR